MKFLVIQKSYLINVVIFLISLFVSWFTLLFGLAHLLEPKNPNVPNSEHMMGVTFCIVLCLIGIVFLLIAFASIKGIIYKIKNK